MTVDGVQVAKELSLSESPIRRTTRRTGPTLRSSTPQNSSNGELFGPEKDGNKRGRPTNAMRNKKNTIRKGGPLKRYLTETKNKVTGGGLYGLSSQEWEESEVSEDDELLADSIIVSMEDGAAGNIKTIIKNEKENT